MLTANMPSIEDELAAIERSANNSNNIMNSTNNNNNNACDRGKSSIPHGSISSVDSNNYDKNELLMPIKEDMGSKARQRNSMSLNPGALSSALAGLSDSDDSDDNSKVASPPPVVQQKTPNPKASGGPDHRPLVGGFSAAAYEAARVDHYKKQGKEVRGHQERPMGYNNFPRYP